MNRTRNDAIEAAREAARLAKIKAQDAIQQAKARMAPGAPKDIFADLPDGESAEDDCKIEMDAVRSAYADRIANQRKQVADAIDTEFWFAVYFRSREQKNQFLHAIGMLAEADKYIDGERLADTLGIDLAGGEAVFTVRDPCPKLAAIAEV
jgi:hypothetical protein